MWVSTRKTLLCIIAFNSSCTKFYMCTYSTGGGKYCDERVRMCVCQSVCLSARISQKSACTNFIKFSVRVKCGRGLIVIWRQRMCIYASGLVDDIMFSHNGPMSTTTLCFVKFARWHHRGRSVMLISLLIIFFKTFEG